jgi:hypothetical protein
MIGGNIFWLGIVLICVGGPVTLVFAKLAMWGREGGPPRSRLHRLKKTFVIHLFDCLCVLMFWGFVAGFPLLVIGSAMWALGL